MKCNLCGSKFFVNANNPTACPGCGVIHLPVVVSQDFLDLAKALGEKPQLLAQKWVREAFEKAREQMAADQARYFPSKEGVRA